MHSGCLSLRSGKVPLDAQIFYDSEILTLTRVLCFRSARAEYNEFVVCGSIWVEYNGSRVCESTGVDCGFNAKMFFFEKMLTFQEKVEIS